ncbi:THAP domain-containing protein 1-like [Onthophagus taurus]|uniref:THAP domain-containing protein 1-like n=1 Tax=Onthophagus taurus TaxID=166361 RepID=UPI0039BDCC36
MYKCSRFPLNKPGVLKKWIKEVRRKNFKPTDYQIRPGASKGWLKEDAFPSVFKGFPNPLQKPPPSKRRLLSRVIEKEKKADDIENMPSTTPDLSEISEQNAMHCDVGIQCIIQPPTKIKLRRKIKILQQQVKRRDVRIKSLNKFYKPNIL